jgi:hypothetical protein
MSRWSCGTLKRFGDVFLQFIVVFSPDQVLPSLYSENNMDVICVSVLAMICRSDGVYRNFFRGNYRNLAPTEHALALEMSKLQARGF